MNIYLNIDGVLRLHSNQLAPYAANFLRLVIRRWPDSTYWLTLQSRGGRFGSHELFQKLLPQKTIEQLRTIQPATWYDHKTDGINFKQPFLWYDDMLTPEEQRILQRYDALDCFRQINLQADPQQLLDEIEYLRTLA